MRQANGLRASVLWFVEMVLYHPTPRFDCHRRFYGTVLAVRVTGDNDGLSPPRRGRHGRNDRPERNRASTAASDGAERRPGDALDL